MSEGSHHYLKGYDGFSFNSFTELMSENLIWDNSLIILCLILLRIDRAAYSCSVKPGEVVTGIIPVRGSLKDCYGQEDESMIMRY